MGLKMKIEYIETIEDRKIGLENYKKVEELMGSSMVWLSMSLLLCVVGIIEVGMDISIVGYSYITVPVALIGIWYFASLTIKERRIKKEKKDIEYVLDFDNGVIEVSHKKYKIKNGYNFENSLLLLYSKGLVTISKKKIKPKELEFIKKYFSSY
jgi:hypothetical protein